MSNRGGPHSAARLSIAYWIYNYQPQWEAGSQELAALMSTFDASHRTYLFNLSTKSRQWRLFSTRKYLPLPYSLIGMPLVRRYSARFTINHLFAGPAAPFLTTRLKAENSLLTITKDTHSSTAMERSAEGLKRFRYVVVESERHRELLSQLGIEPSRVRLIHPGVQCRPYCPAEGRFKVLFATSPMARHDLLSRGVRLMIESASRLSEVEFILIWRDIAIKDLNALIRQAGVTNVRVINGYLPDIDRYYDEVHATILPGLNHNSLKPCPHSFLHSIAHGKPVLVSRPTSVAGLVEQTGCGVVFEPTTACLVEALGKLQLDYEAARDRCHPVARRYFSPQVFIDKYRELYETIG